MITVTSNERLQMIASAEQTLMVKAFAALCDLRSGRDISEVDQALCVAYASLESLEHYTTGKFDPAEYFNVISPDNVSEIYSSLNTIN